MEIYRARDHGAGRGLGARLRASCIVSAGLVARHFGLFGYCCDGACLEVRTSNHPNIKPKP